MEEDSSSVREFAGLIGRFQPWHLGHQGVLEDMVAQGYQPILFLGSSNADADREKNPFTFQEREQIIHKACHDLRYPDGSEVVPVCVPIYDHVRGPDEKPYFDGDEKRVPLNTKWFAQFVDFFEEHHIEPEQFTLFYSAKDQDRKNYVFDKEYSVNGRTLTLPNVSDDGTVFEGEDLSLTFELLGAKRHELPVTYENATDVRLNYEASTDLLVPGTKEVIDAVIFGARLQNDVYDGEPLPQDVFEQDPMQVLRHERRVRDTHIHKSPDDPSFHKRVLLIGGAGSLGLPVIESLLEQGHDLVLNHYSPADNFKANVAEIAERYPNAEILFQRCDLRDPETWDSAYWKDQMIQYDVDAVINMAGIIEEKPDIGLTFENINYRPVKAMAQACVDVGIDRYIYFSTITARSEEAQQNATSKQEPLTYAGSKRKAEIALEEFSGDLNWISVRPITVFNPKKPDWGRPMTFPHIANLSFMPVLGTGNQALQPLYVEDLAKVSRLVESNIKGGKILDAVGPEQISLREALDILRKPSDDSGAVSETVRINVTYDVAEFLAETYPYGAINPTFVKVMKNRESGTDEIPSLEWAKAIGEEGQLRSLSDVYSEPDVQFAEPPIVEYAGMVAKNPEPLYQFLARKLGAAPIIDKFRQVFADYMEDTSSEEARETMMHSIFKILRKINVIDDDNDRKPGPA